MRRSVQWKPWRRRHGGALAAAQRLDDPLLGKAQFEPRSVQKPLKETAKYEYEDHPADIRIRARGSLPQCLVSLAVGVHAYMTDLTKIEQRSLREISCAAKSVADLVFQFVSRAFDLYCEDYFIVKAIVVRQFASERGGGYRVVADCAGETFDRARHSQGTEVKAITKHDLTVEVEGDGNGEESTSSPSSPVSGKTAAAGGSATQYNICMLVDI